MERKAYLSHRRAGPVEVTVRWLPPPDSFDAARGEYRMEVEAESTLRGPVRPDVRRLLTPTEYALLVNEALEMVGAEERWQVPVEPIARPEPPGEPLHGVIGETLGRVYCEIERIERHLSASILVGQPWILVCKEPGGNFDLVYGTGYEGQPERCFRWQRGPMLCGAVQMDLESANRAVALLREKKIEARPVHERDYLRGELERLRESADSMRRALEHMEHKTPGPEAKAQMELEERAET